jgi:serine/threonine-protein kinase
VATREEPSPEVAEGRVITTEPAPNTNAPAGSTVTIVVSSGPEETPVPNVIGRTESSAISRLESAGFEVTVTTQSSTAANDGRVIAQSPASGELAAAGSTVNITVGVFEPPVTTTTTGATTTAP